MSPLLPCRFLIRFLRRVSLGIPLLVVPLLAQSPEDFTADSVVALPPFYVEPDNPFNWTALTAPGLEIITTHDRDFAVAFARSYYRQLELIRLIIPDRYFWWPAESDKFIVVEPDHQRSKTDRVVGQILDQEQARTGQRRGRVFLPNFGLNSPDSTIVFAFHDRVTPLGVSPFYGRQSAGTYPFDSGASEIGFHSNTNRITDRLSRRSPAIPAWAIIGLVELYDECKFFDQRIVIAGLPTLPPPPVPPAPPPHVAAPSTVDTPPASAETPPPPPPIEHLNFPFLFAQPIPADAASRAAWRDQAHLFVRWALFAEDQKYREAFWTFIDRQEHALATEDTFTTCFGLTFAAANAAITIYRADAARDATTLRLSDFEPPTRLRAERAKPAQVARILAEWEQLETAYVRKVEPDLTPVYLQRARAAIASARQAGATSRELTAVSGLLEFEAGNADVALPELEAARALGVTRPYVLQSLARLQFETTKAALPRATRLNLEQAGPILSLLRQAHEQAPAIPEVYQLFAEVWVDTALPLLRDDVVVLAEGARRFPQHPEVIMRMALLQADRLNLASAGQIINYAIPRTHRPEVHAAYQKFAQELARRLPPIPTPPAP